MGGRRERHVRRRIALRSIGLSVFSAVLGMAPGWLAADTRVIDSPTAEPLGHGYMRWEVGVGAEGAVLSSVRVGVFERGQFGLAYGMLDVLGRGEVDANPRVGVLAEFLLLDQYGLPAIALGFDSQGRGRWLDEHDRYERKSHGFYAVATQHLAARSLPIVTSISGGINFSMEGKKESFDLFAGLTQNLGRHFAVMLDFDFGLDDRLDADRGYFDLGFQGQFGNASHVRFVLRDLLGNQNGDGQVGRELNFFYLFRL
jgi:hypothetical protein